MDPAKKNGPDGAEMQTYISTVLNLHAKGELRHQSAVDGLMKLCVYLKMEITRWPIGCFMGIQTAATGPVPREISQAMEG